MSNFENQLEILSGIVFEEEDFSKAEALILEMIKADHPSAEADTFSEFLSLGADAIEDIEISTTYSIVTKWAVSKYNQEKSNCITNAMQYADSINTWLNHRIELVDDPAGINESKIALSLFADIINNSNDAKTAEESTNDYQGYATYSLLLGLSDGNSTLINNAIDAQRKVLSLYQKGKSPEYYNIATFVAGAKRGLASTLMEAYEFDRGSYSQYYQEIGELLHGAIKDFETCGTDFDRGYAAKLLKKYEGYVQ